MPSLPQVRNCVDCDTPVYRVHLKGRKPRCIEHSTARVVENIVQLRARRGPFYDIWAAAMVRAADAAAMRAVLNGIEDQAVGQ